MRVIPPQLLRKELVDLCACSVCHDVRLPLRTCSAGHVMCSQCAGKVFERAPQCPVCRRTIEEDVANKAVEKMLLLTVVACCGEADRDESDEKEEAGVGVGDGCGWGGTLADWMEHRDSCPHVHIPCRYKERGCAHRAARGEMPLHIQGCDHRDVVCGACSEKIEAGSMAEHLAEACPERSITCPGCLAEMPARLHSRHEETCPDIEQCCPLCDARMSRSALAAHHSSVEGIRRHAAVVASLKESVSALRHRTTTFYLSERAQSLTMDMLWCDLKLGCRTKWCGGRYFVGFNIPDHYMVMAFPLPESELIRVHISVAPHRDGNATEFSLPFRNLCSDDFVGGFVHGVGLLEGSGAEIRVTLSRGGTEGDGEGIVEPDPRPSINFDINIRSPEEYLTRVVEPTARGLSLESIVSP